MDSARENSPRIKYGAHIFLWTDRWTDASFPLLERARALGLDFLELALGDDVTVDAAAVRPRLEALGLELAVSPGGVWPMACDISLDDAADRRKGLAWHRRNLDTAAALGAVAYTGAIYGHPGHIEYGRPSPAILKRTAAALHDLAEYAKRNGVALVIEPMSRFRTTLVNTPAQALRLLELAAHENLSVLFDTYHMVTELRDYGAAIRALGDRLWGLHACENDRGLPGGGLVPWAEIARALEDIRFAGRIGLETYNSRLEAFAVSRGLFGDVCPDGDTFVRRGLAFLRDLLEKR
jgi:D-psicose/D-tagatose/L-ribulose 3-epimerase